MSLPFTLIGVGLFPWIFPSAQEDPVRARLDESPRHHEWVVIERGERKLHAFVVFPETKEKAAAVLLIHENKGLTDWVRAVADQVAEAGYIAIAPDLLSGMAPEGGRTEDFERVDAATKALYALDAAQVIADLDAASTHVLALDGCNGKLSVAGFCWGGSRTWDFAAQRKGLKSAFVFYGSAPEDTAALATIECPVYGFYGGEDARVNGSLERTSAAMKAHDKRFEPIIYEGGGHGFLRAGEAPDASEANKQARAEAWERWKKLLSA